MNVELKKEEKKEEKPKKVIQEVDENSMDAYRAMGYEEVSDNMKIIHNKFKVYKDKVHPGRLSPEALAMVAVVSDMADCKIELCK